MSTIIRAQISEKNRYYINKHRHYELKHFCLQYPIWKRTYIEIEDVELATSSFERTPSCSLPSDPTAKQAIMKARLIDRIKMIEKIAREADEYLYDYILKAVTEGLSYTYLKTRLNIPCGKDMYYDRYRRFFWLLNKARD